MLPSGTFCGLRLQLDLEQDTLALSARSNDSVHANVGKVHVFERIDGVWTPRVRLSASDQRQGDGLGTGIAITGPTAGKFLLGVTG